MKAIQKTKSSLSTQLKSRLEEVGLYVTFDHIDRNKIAEEPEVQRFYSHKSALKGDELNEVIQHLRQLTARETDREKQIDSKALSLLGFTGLVSSIIIGFFQLGRDSSSMTLILRVLLGIDYVAIGICLLRTVQCAMEAVKVAKYEFMFPSEEDLFELARDNRERIYQEHAYDLVKSFVYNQSVINAKATYVSVAQNWFKRAIILFTILLFLFTFQFLFPTQISTPPATLPAVIVLTTTPQPVYQLPTSPVTALNPQANSPSSTQNAVPVTSTVP